MNALEDEQEDDLAQLIVLLTGTLIYFPLLAYTLERRKAEVPNWRRLTIVFTCILALESSVRSAVLEFMTNFDTARYDQYVFEIDRRLFGSPSFATRQFLNGHQWLWWPVAHAYDNLARIVVLLLFWFLWTQPIEDVWLYIRSLVINPFLAVLVYVMFPVSGPIYAFKNFPELPSADLIPHVIHLAARPNCIPSVHMSSAILLFWLVRKWIVGRIFGLAFLVLTVLATLGSGEHYFFDLMLAVPHTALVFWLSGYSVRAREATISLPQESAPAA